MTQDEQYLDLLSIFHYVAAAVECLVMPFGTVLGILTIILLMTESVGELSTAHAYPGMTL